MGKLIDLTGFENEYIKVICRCGMSKGGNALWLCQCKCGKQIIRQGRNIKNSKTKGCGCYHKKKMTKHGLYGTRIYRIWCLMKTRCYRKNHKSYKNYGGRGIKVCDEWLNDFKIFYEWAIKNGYKENLTLDRIDVNGDYEPTNCKWSTMKEQQNNRRNNIFLEYNGVRKTVAEWAEEKKIIHSTLLRRIKRGYTVEQALTKKNDKRKIMKGKKI